MLLNTHSPISGVAAKKDTGVVVYGGNVPTSARIEDLSTNLIGSQAKYDYISLAATGASLYVGSGINGGTLAADDRDDAMIYGSQKTDLAGVANKAKLGNPVAGPFDMPHKTLTDTVTVYPSGYDYATGAPITVTTTGEIYGSADDAATGTGELTIMEGNITPVNKDYPTRN